MSSPLGLRDEGKAERHLRRGAEAARCRDGAEAVRRRCPVYRCVQVGADGCNLRGERSPLALSHCGVVREVDRHAQPGVEAAAGCERYEAVGQRRRAPRTHQPLQSKRLGTTEYQGSQLRHR